MSFKGQSHQYVIAGNCLFCLHLKPTLLTCLNSRLSLFSWYRKVIPSALEPVQYLFSANIPCRICAGFPTESDSACSERSAEEKPGFQTMNAALPPISIPMTPWHLREQLQTDMHIHTHRHAFTIRYFHGSVHNTKQRKKY